MAEKSPLKYWSERTKEGEPRTGDVAGQSTMVVPSLRGQQPEYLLRVMKEYRDGERGNSMMHKMSSGYSDALLGEIAEYYASDSGR